jgi:hypothetical protein
MSRMRSITRPLLALAAPRGPQGDHRLRHGHPKDLAVMGEAHSDSSGDDGRGIPARHGRRRTLTTQGRPPGADAAQGNAARADRAAEAFDRLRKEHHRPAWTHRLR